MNELNVAVYFEDQEIKLADRKLGQSMRADLLICGPEAEEIDFDPWTGMHNDRSIHGWVGKYYWHHGVMLAITQPSWNRGSFCAFIQWRKSENDPWLSMNVPGMDTHAKGIAYVTQHLLPLTDAFRQG